MNALRREQGRALDRTIRLLRDELARETFDEEVLSALLSTKVLIVSDWPNIKVGTAQHAVTSLATLSARMGASVWISAPNEALVGMHPPLAAGRLVDALEEVGGDLIPGVAIHAGRTEGGADIAFLVGDTPMEASLAPLVYRLTGDAWCGHLTRADADSGSRWAEHVSPFGALIAAELAAIEVGKCAVRRLSGRARDAGMFEHLFAPRNTVSARLAPQGSPDPNVRLGEFDVVSAGAIAQSALASLSRLQGVSGSARIFDDDINDITGLNRNNFQRRSLDGLGKAGMIAGALEPSGLVATAVPEKLAEAPTPAISALADRVMVGVDDIAARWYAQARWPAWLAIGATSHFDSQLTLHPRGAPCAWCAHPRNTPQDAPIPTIAVVSNWSGLQLAAAFAREVSGFGLTWSERNLYACVPRLGTAWGTWVSPTAARADCPYGCQKAA